MSGHSLPIAPPAPAPAPTLDPYRVFFPLGLAFAVAGAAPWVWLAATGAG